MPYVPPKLYTQKQFRQLMHTDDVMANTIADLRQNFDTQRTQTTKNKDDLTADFDLTNQRLGNNQNLDRKKMLEDYAARGMLNSSVYLGENQQLDKSYGEQTADAQASYDRKNAELDTGLQQARNLYRQQRSDAYLAAVRRRAARLGITG